MEDPELINLNVVDDIESQVDRDPGKTAIKDGEVSLSHAQQRLWFLDQLNQDRAAYNVSDAFRLMGPLDVIALEKCINELIRRQAALSASFHSRDGQPFQIIEKNLSVRIRIVDLQDLPEGEQAAAALGHARMESCRPFDLAQPPLFRVTLMRLGEKEHVLLWVAHQIISDSWSKEILWRQLTLLYGTLAIDEQPSIPEISFQYADYVEWQRRHLQGDFLEEGLNYWRRELEGAPPLLDLPTDRPRPTAQSYRGAKHRIEIPESLTRELMALNREEGVTMFMTLLAAFQTLLYRYSGQDDVVVGSPVANRASAEVEGLIGLFANTLALRAKISSGDTFRSLLRRVRNNVLSAFRRQDIPFEMLLSDLDIDRDLSRNPLVQAMFTFQNVPVPLLELTGLTVKQLEVDTGKALFDLTLNLTHTNDCLSGFIEYNTDLFDAATISRMAGNFQTLLQSISVDLDQRIAELPILTEAERHQLLVEWNDTTVEYPSDKCVHQLFEEQVERTPEAIALIFEERELTYRELNERANQLAHYLRGLGVEPETLVGLYLDRSPELIVGILGILKAGCAYMPMDITYPKQRLEFMLSDAAVHVQVTQNAFRAHLSEHSSKMVCLDGDAPRLAEMELTNPALPYSSDGIAYTMYTSGSTGKPKGVEITHLAVVNFLTSMAAKPGMTHRDRILAVATPTFDISVLELMLPLTVGACVEVASRELVSDAVNLAKRLSESGATMMQATPSTWQMLIHGGWERSGNLKALCGGEALTKILADELLQRCGELWNMYGPTETTIYSVIEQVGVEWRQSMIGRPIANTQVYVLNSHNQPQPIGVIGELFIGGEGLSRGYHNQSKLTQERFIERSFDGGQESRLYRTGDLCRWHADGRLEFLSRIDGQVKLRGFRIELSEIEAVLAEYSGIKESVVIIREDSPGDKRLVAYLVIDQKEPVTTPALRRALAKKLPEYMIPVAFVRLDALPLTPSGKLDRRALPAPDALRPELETGYVSPQTPIEEELATIWSVLLGVERVGIHDNFFELGGHSLVAIRVIVRISSQMGVDLSVRSLFEAPTIAGLANKIEELRRSGVGMSSAHLVRVAREPGCGLPLSFSQQRLWFLEQLEGDLTAYNMSFAWRIRGALDTEALRGALEMLINRYEALRTTYEMVDGEAVQEVGEEVKFVLPEENMASLEGEAQEEEISRFWREEAGRAFDLSEDLMLRAFLLQLSENEHVLLLVVHHIACDGWSLDVLRRELGMLYRANCLGKAASLSPLAIQYADFAIWQREVLASGDRLEKLIAYWREQLRGLETLELPTDRSRPVVPSYRGARYEFEMPGELVDRLKTLGQREGATLQMTLLAAFQLLLSRYTGQEDIAVGTPISGRNHAELEEQIGFFVNTLVLRTDLSGEPSFRELLGRVREMSLGAYDHQDLPFEKLVEELQPGRELGRSPLFQVLFQLINFLDNELQLENLEVIRLPSIIERVRFDLEIHLWQRPEMLIGEIIYSTDLFDATRIERMVGHFLTLLEGIAAEPEKSIGELPMLTEAERQQLLVEWNDTTVEYPSDKCVHQLFEEQVERTPETIAVVFEESELTYRELNERANQLAHYLLGQGVEPETLVGLYLDRSPELIVGILGILKAGGAYVPFSIEDPADRLKFMIEEAGVKVILSAGGIESRWIAESSGNVQIVQIDRDARDCANSPVEVHVVHNRPEQVAYLMYTSGSTGRPKGVAIRHRSILRLLFGNKLFDLEKGRTLLQLAPVAFDASTFEIWGALLHGGRLILAPVGPPDFAVLETLISAHKVETLWLTTSLFNLVVDTSPQMLRTLDQIIVGGEALSVSHVIRAFSHICPQARLINGYGPTETTTFATTYLIPRTLDQSVTSVPIGRPISNTQVYVLDRNRQPAPIGVSGELFIGGDGLAQGYFKRSALMAERFVQDPFTRHSGSRLYRTGDLCRWREDGNLEFLGRLDDQVKLRGYRIELGEIESVLNGHPEVAQSVVIIREDRPGDKRLVAYFVPAPEKKPTIAGIRTYLQSQLPDYMVPVAFCALDSMPMTTSGKIQRSALPKPGDIPKSDIESSVPKDLLELRLMQIWMKLFDRHSIGRQSNFFELGGHSLLAVQLAAKVEKLLGRRLPIASLFQAPTIESLASMLRDENWTPPWSSLVPLQPLGSKPPFFFVHGMGGNVYVYVNLARSLAADQPVYGIQSEDCKGAKNGARSIEELASHYVEEIRSFQGEGPYYLGGYSLGGWIAFEIARQLTEQRQKVQMLAFLDTDLCCRVTTPEVFLMHLRHSLPYLAGRVGFHARQFFEMNIAEQVDYVKGRWTALHKILLKPLRQTLLKPVALEDSNATPAPAMNFEGVDYRVLCERYRPAKYSGTVDLFKTDEMDPACPIFLNKLVRGGVKIHRVPGSHRSMMKGPEYLSEVAEVFGNALEAAQDNDSGQG